MYSQYTRSQFTSELAIALSDPNHTYWALDELERALNEALLHWGALSSYWTTSGLFDTVANTPFYDLSAELPALRTRAYTLGNLYKEIQYHLFEPATGVAGGGIGATDQFTITQITNALARRRNQFVIDSRIPLTFSQVNVPAPPVDTMAITQDVALIARAAWIDAATGVVTPLRRTDTFAAQSYSPIWNLNPGKPYGYSQVESMPLTLILVPPPLASGAIHLTYAKTITMAVADATLLQVPDEFAGTIKWGALYEILSTNSQGYDPIRTKYALERYTAGIELTAMLRSVMRVRANNIVLPVTTLARLDAGTPYWQTGTGPIEKVACAYDLLAFKSVPGAVYSITCDVVQAAPLPTADGDFIQVGPEEMGYLMDYCRHILQFKVGGVEFVQSMPLYDNFLKGATQRNKLIAAKARYLTPLFNQPQLQESENHAA